MNEHLRLLIDLQEIDSAILSIAERIETLPERLSGAKAGLKETTALLEKVKAGMEQSNKTKKRKYDELDDMQGKIDKLKARSTEIKTNKEYEAYLREIKSFEDRKSRIEDEILAAMETADALAKELKKQEANFKKSDDDYRKEEKVIEEERNGLHAEMDAFKLKRKEIVKRLDEEIYERYMNLVKGSGGVAVVQTRNEVCLGCHTNIPPQLYNDIRRNEEVFACCYCNRFLYYLPEQNPAGTEK